MSQSASRLGKITHRCGASLVGSDALPGFSVAVDETLAQAQVEGAPESPLATMRARPR